MTAHGSWSEANQAYLGHALAELKGTLQRHAARCPGCSDATNIDPPLNPLPLPNRTASQSAFTSGLPALDVVSTAFHLSSFERDVLLLCVGIELDSDFAPLCAAAQSDPARNYPTFSLALATLPDAHWSALAPTAPLRRWRLIEPGTGPVLTVAPLRIDERVLHYLVGISHLDERLAGIVEPLEPAAADGLVPSHAAVVERIVTAWSATRGGCDTPVIQLCGPDPADCRAIATAAAKAVGLQAAVLPADLVPTSAAELEALLRLWEREAVLAGIGVLLLEWDDVDLADRGEETRTHSHGITRLIGRLHGLVILCERERRRIAHRPAVTFEVRHPLLQEQRNAWRAALSAADAVTQAAIDAVTAQFNLGVPTIHSVATEAIAHTVAAPGQGIAAAATAAWDLCRTHLRARLDGLAQRIDATVAWEDLVLPDAQRQVLREIATHVRQRITVYDHWGFAAKSSRGLGISALFAGPSGTGKTMAAEVLANELRLDLYRIDLSSVVSKYIGETEKNLRRVFDAAEESGAILLFDEADALFGKRSEVKDSHDRYANIEVSYLLQRMEAYRGLAILTSNLKSALDTAFLRRLRFVVQFPFPDVPQRAEIWRRIFPVSTPTEGLDVSKLAKLNIPGGNIRNIAMNAAFLAADMAEPVRMRHLLAAARSEYTKLERPLTESDIGGWL